MNKRIAVVAVAVAVAGGVMAGPAMAAVPAGSSGVPVTATQSSTEQTPLKIASAVFNKDNPTFLTVSGTGKPTSIISVQANDESTSVWSDGYGNWSVALLVPVSQGSEVTVSVRGAYVDLGTDRTVVHRDVVSLAPVKIDKAVAGVNEQGHRVITLSGTGEPGAFMYVGYDNWDETSFDLRPDANGNWSYTMPAPDFLGTEVGVHAVGYGDYRGYSDRTVVQRDLAQ
ncbi:hypothetical protein [Streptomyces sp. N35]|uniref:hypothetical protein n=1 Tax=Streptomyces sp. N35 TaxID=2795730 RepID=UPI0018F3F854|nr:hypothetical protein [Streptomyces sp. N35]